MIKIFRNILLIASIFMSAFIYLYITDKNSKDFISLMRLKEDICVIDLSVEDTIQKKENLERLLLNNIDSNIFVIDVVRLYTIINIGIIFFVLFFNIKRK